MICPYCNLTNEPWSNQIDLGNVSRCEHPDNRGDQGYARRGIRAGRDRPSGHCRPECRFLSLAESEQWRRERAAIGGGCCGS